MLSFHQIIHSLRTHGLINCPGYFFLGKIHNGTIPFLDPGYFVGFNHLNLLLSFSNFNQYAAFEGPFYVIINKKRHKMLKNNILRHNRPLDTKCCAFVLKYNSSPSWMSSQFFRKFFSGGKNA